MELHEEEWELVNDDGFVYKRIKRLPTISISTAPPPPPAEERNHHRKKAMILLKLKTKYQQEILNWEHLSNTLMALQTHPQPSVLPDLPLSLSTERSSDSTHCELAETLLLQVEAQEAFINEVSTLCDAAESICSAQEQLLKQPFIYLPIWESSPRKLITSLLCEEE